MKKCIVIGGGFAGLSSAVFLSEHNIQVQLIEASPKLGGRAYSLTNKNFNDLYDNGQHILMGCYSKTLDFINKIGSIHLLEIQDSLNVNFVKRGGEIFKLKSSKKFYPFNLLRAILGYKALPLKSRLKIIDFFIDLICCYPEDLQNITVSDWLKIKKQDDDAIKSFWEILVVGALNTSPGKASAEIFADVLEEIFLNGSVNAKIILPGVGLSELFAEPSQTFIESRGGKIICSEKLTRFEFNGKRCTKVITDKAEYSDFDFAVAAIPTYSLDRIFSDQNIDVKIPRIDYSPILNVHLWLNNNPFNERFYGLINSDIHWLFNNRAHISLTTSNAEALIHLPDKEILERLLSDLEIFFPIFKSNFVVDSMIIKEKRATFTPDIGSTTDRKKIKFNFENLFIAGDWINTGLPSTIESAVLSGRLAADQILNSLKV